MLWRHAAVDPSLRWMDGKHVHRPLSEPFPKHLASWTIFWENQNVISAVFAHSTKLGTDAVVWKGLLKLQQDQKWRVLYLRVTVKTYN
jgi:hypothetical protein